MKVKSEREVAQSCLTLSDPMNCSLPGSCVHGIFQARVLEWGAIAFSRGSEGGSFQPLQLLMMAIMAPWFMDTSLQLLLSPHCFLCVSHTQFVSLGLGPPS